MTLDLVSRSLGSWSSLQRSDTDQKLPEGLIPPHTRALLDSLGNSPVLWSAR